MTRVDSRPLQNEWCDAAHQQRNVEGACALAVAASAGPVLLVDGLVDSTWMIVEGAGVLRAAGTPVVHPAALASVIAR